MKKLLAICLSVLLICAAMPFAFATAAEDPTIVVSDVEGKAGETVSVTVSMKNNPGIVSTKVKVGYDASALEFVSKEMGDFSASGYSWGQDTKNPFVINWCDAINPDSTAELLATLTFKIKDDAVAGTYPLTLEYDNEGDIYNATWDTVVFGADEGSVTVVADEPTYEIPETPEGALYFAHFQTGDLTGWQSGCSLEVVPENDGLAMKWDASGADWANMYNYSTNVSKNADYILVMDVKADRNTNMNLKVLKGDWSADAFATTFDVTTEWQNVTVPFSTNDGSFLLLSSNTKAASGATYYLDNITVFKAPETPVEPSFDGYIYNGDFQTGDLTNWINLYDNNTVEFVEGLDSNNAISITTDKSWAQVRQNGIKVEPNTDYVLTGWFKNNTNLGYCVKAGDDSGDIKSFLPSETYGDWTKVSLEFNSGDQTEICVLLMSWENGGSAIIDNVSLAKVEKPVEPDYKDPTIVVSGAEGNAGDEITVTVSMKKNPGIVSTKVKIGYDDSVLELLSYEMGDFSTSGYSWGQLTKNPFVINWCDAISPDSTAELLATLTFKIKATAASGEYPLTLTYDNEGDIYNSAWATVVFGSDVGAITVVGGACQHEYDGACDPECNLCGEIRDVHTNLIHFEAVDAGCHYNGNIEYWFCPDCEGFWADEALTQVTNSKNVIVPALGGEVIHFDAIAPGCHYDGQIEHWFCPECEQFWQDEALTQITNSKNVILPATGSENLQHVEAVAPTCYSEGNIEYWYCPDCEQYWQDEALTQLTNSKNVILGMTDHNIIHFDAVAPGCHYNGNIEYWFCSICETFWQDEALTQITNSKNVIVPAVGGEVIHFEAIEPGCHYDGQIEHWFCPECEQFWQDEALTQLTNSKNVVLPATGSENLQHVEAKAPTCSEAGNIEYWYCPDCEQYWQDAALTQLTNSKNVIVAPIDHTIVHIEAVEPGCHYIGNIEYWYCSVCEMFWQDEALTQITNSKNVIVPALGGDVIHFEAIEPACHYDGQIEHWFCPECEQFWQDEALTQLTNSKNVVLPATGSENLQHVEAKDPTCSEAGNIEYWYCPDCEQYWQDEALTQLTNSKNVLIAPVDHTIVHIEAVEPGCHYIGNIEYWYCSVCEMFWQDEALTQITNSKNVIVPALGGDVVHFEAIEPGCHYDGQIEYWFCPECEQFWQDEALTQITNSKNVVLPATGSENLKHVEYKAPTATENGNIEYWYCEDCEQFWTDEALTQLTNSKNVIIPATGEEPGSPETGDSIVPVVVALLTLIGSGVAVSVLKKRA